MNLLIWFFLISGFSPNSQRIKMACPNSGEKSGFYSQLAINLCFQDDESERRHLEIPSPDGSVVLVVDGYRGKFVEKGHQIGEQLLIMRNSDVIWSPDSRAVVLTSSLGAIGPVTAAVIYVHTELFQEEPDITNLVQQEFASHHPHGPCSKEVNVGGLSWEPGSKSAVFLAQVPPSSSCGGMLGYFEAYVVTLPKARIVARYPQKDAIQHWRKILRPEMLEGN